MVRGGCRLSARLSSGYPRAVRDGAGPCARAHRHGRVEIVVHLGLEKSLVQPLGVRVGGRHHLVLWHHLYDFGGLMARREGEMGADAKRRFQRDTATDPSIVLTCSR